MYPQQSLSPSLAFLITRALAVAIAASKNNHNVALSTILLASVYVIHMREPSYILIVGLYQSESNSQRQSN